MKRHGRLKVLDDAELVVEFEAQGEYDALQKALATAFGGEADLEPISRNPG